MPLSSSSLISVAWREARRRLREMLLELEADGLRIGLGRRQRLDQRKALALGHGRQRRRLVIVGRLVLPFEVDAHEAVELHHLAGGAEDRVADFDIDGGAVVHRGVHLARDEAIVR